MPISPFRNRMVSVKKTEEKKDQDVKMEDIIEIFDLDENEKEVKKEEKEEEHRLKPKKIDFTEAEGVKKEKEEEKEGEEEKKVKKEKEEEKKEKEEIAVRMFHDENLITFFRRCAFSPDGRLLLAPAGIYSEGISSTSPSPPLSSLFHVCTSLSSSSSSSSDSTSSSFSFLFLHPSFPFHFPYLPPPSLFSFLLHRP